MKFGRNRPLVRAPRLSLKNYLLKSLPTPPSSKHYAPDAQKALTQIYLNDKLSNCVIACMAHLVGVFTGNADGGTPVIYTTTDIVNMYSAIGGYVPGDPSTDNGCDEQTALHYWQQNGAPNGEHQITGFMAVNGADKNEVQTAQWLFENLVFGVELPNEWVNPFPSADGFVWDVAGPPNMEQGHCVGGVGFDEKGVKISSWGMIGTMTYDAVAKYAVSANGGELYTVLSQDSINKATQKAGSGFDFTQLQADLQAING